MFKKVVPVTKENHSHLFVKGTDNFLFAKDFHIAPIALKEFFRAAAYYPIIFLEEPSSKELRPVALLGLQQGENLYIDDQGKWLVPYVPAAIRRYPFTLAPTQDPNQFLICVDEESDLVGTEEGNPLFTAEGELSETMEHVRKYLTELHQMEQFTHQVCKELKDMNLFTSMNLNFQNMGQTQQIRGLYLVNEENLNKLGDNEFLKLRRSNALPAIYAHLASLPQADRLAQFRRDGEVPPATN